MRTIGIIFWSWVFIKVLRFGLRDVHRGVMISLWAFFALWLWLDWRLRAWPVNQYTSFLLNPNPYSSIFMIYGETPIRWSWCLMVGCNVPHNPNLYPVQLFIWEMICIGVGFFYIVPWGIGIPLFCRLVLYPLLTGLVVWYYSPSIRIPTGGQDINEQRVIGQLYRPSRWLPWRIDSRTKVERLQWLTERLRQETNLMDQVKAYKKKRKEES